MILDKSRVLGVGIIGVSPNGGWGSGAHVPALKGLPEKFKITSISASHQESANESANKFGVPNAFVDPYELASHPDVDIVAVTVRVPEHDKLVRAVLKAGKHVYCEWPLGRTTDEANDLLSIAEEKGVHHTVGLQSRVNPAIMYVKDLLSDGFVGEIQSVNVNYTLSNYYTVDNIINKHHVYLLDVNNGADILSVATGHMLDGISFMIGEFLELSSILETQIKERKVVETGEIIASTAYDNIAVSGLLSNRAIISVHVRIASHSKFSIEINGSKGTLLLSNNGGLMFQMNSFKLQGSQEKDGVLNVLEVPPKYYWVQPNLRIGTAFNVAQLYTQFYKDVMNNTHLAPSFYNAVRTHNLLDFIKKSSKTGTKQYVDMNAIIK